MHNGQFSALMIEPVAGERDARLAVNLTYVTGWGYSIEVPAGYRSDLASIPKFARLFFDRYEFDTERLPCCTTIFIPPTSRRAGLLMRCFMTR